MDPITGSMFLGATGASMGAGLLGTAMTNQANAQQVQGQEAFQQQMSNTAYQRSTKDMQAAGLNPALMYGSGAAASTPQGAAATMQDPLAGISKGIDTAIGMRQAASSTANQDADTKNKTITADILKNQSQSSAKQLDAQVMTNNILAKTMNAQVKKANAEGDYAQINQLMGIINSGASSASQLVSPANLIKGILPSKANPGFNFNTMQMGK